MVLTREDKQSGRALSMLGFGCMRFPTRLGTIDNPEGEELAQLHKQWITLAWGSASPDAHRGLVQIYTEDERFKEYYESKAGKNSAELLKQSVLKFIR